MFGEPLWTLEEAIAGDIVRGSLDDYVDLLPECIPFNIYTHKTVWSMWEYPRAPDG